MVEATAIRVPIRLRDEIKGLRFDYRVDHLGDVLKILVELGKKYPQEARKLAEEYTKGIYNPLSKFMFTIPFHDTCCPSAFASISHTLHPTPYH